MKAKAVSNLLIGGGAGLLLSTGAIATPYTNTLGTICKNYSAGDLKYIDYVDLSTASIKSATTTVICPLSRDTQSTKGATAYVDVTHSANATTACTLYSYSYTGTLLGSVSRTWTGTGFHGFTLVVPASDAYSDYAVVCNIPGSKVGRIWDVDLQEW
ncbi:hypothetical protein [uncultured Thiodictyon sp.]|jgi:hypothetical protein|uniref:hypothetical protein n=1 Tax=uncultured Thiodictyon sp. TaxID=1846217 RepID=UPI0025E35119|nr:hypothetical protein [uncultured Thiodictyon sp.]